jgi:hypothetical protein
VRSSGSFLLGKLKLLLRVRTANASLTFFRQRIAKLMSLRTASASLSF